MLISLTSLILLIPVMVIAAASPGPDILYILSHSTRQKRIGFVAISGIATGLLIHVTAVSLGLGELFIHVPLAYKTMKWIGAAYLIYLAISILRTKNQSKEIEQAKEVSLKQVYLKGFLTNVLNPKAIIYFTAILPQFVDNELGHIQQQLFILSAIAVIFGVLTHMSLSLLTFYCSKLMKKTSPRFQRLKKYTLASLFGLLAARLAQ